MIPSIFERHDPYADVTPANWPAQREALTARITPWLGTPTPAEAPPSPEVRFLEERPHPEGRLLRLVYESEAGEPIHALALIPHGLTTPAPAVLCLHSTMEAGKETLFADNPKRTGRDFGTQLARAGFITFAPDSLAAGERTTPGLIAYDTAAFYERHPDWSEMGKWLRDHRRALEVMQSAIPEIDGSRIGAVGHSLGGYGSILLAAFEPAIKASASSCGLTTWEGNHEKRLNWARDRFYRHFPALRPLFLADEPLPFELYELIALIAPRPFLNLSGMADATYGNNETLPEVGLRLTTLYRQLGSPEHFANYLFGDGHETPLPSQMLIAGWFRRWLIGS